jgi:hypothetical protein
MIGGSKLEDCGLNVYLENYVIVAAGAWARDVSPRAWLVRLEILH